jgi:DNA-binding FadR family transcriptional regulator
MIRKAAAAANANADDVREAPDALRAILELIRARGLRVGDPLPPIRELQRFSSG